VSQQPGASPDSSLCTREASTWANRQTRPPLAGDSAGLVGLITWPVPDSSLPVGGTAWTAPAKVSTVSSDPAVSAQNNLQRQFWGDYNTLVSGASTAWFIYTDSRNGAGCPAVDAYQTYLADNGLAQPDETDGGKDTGKSGTGASTVAVAKPAPRPTAPRSSATPMPTCR